ncbi:MAG: hypothetical protein JNJ55_11525 [Betaproteobacteria bacterium]|nr:hypothetical protein [Betaproteobacteria bacterium]
MAGFPCLLSSILSDGAANQGPRSARPNSVRLKDPARRFGAARHFFLAPPREINHLEREKVLARNLLNVAWQQFFQLTEQVDR